MKKFFTLFVAVVAMALTAKADVFVIGAINGGDWDPANGQQLTEVKPNVFEGTVNVNKGGWFGLVTKLDSSWDVVNANRLYPDNGKSDVVFNDDNVAVIELNTEKNGSDAWSIGNTEPMDFIFTVDLNDYTFTIKSTKVVEKDENIYVVGDLSSWDFDKTYMMTKTAEGLYEINNVKIGGGFKLANPGWKPYNFGAPADSAAVTVITIGEPFAAFWAEDSKNMTIGEDVSVEYTVNVKLDFTNAEAPTVLVTSAEGGVEGIEIDAEAPAVYYNLQGVQVATPAKGLYIVRRGNKASKVFVK